jgi:hypothetical protein
VILITNILNVFGQQASVLGSWKTGDIDPLNYAKQTTNASTPNSEPVNTYKFLANGNYEYTSFRRSTTGNCSLTFFNFNKGKYVITGETITLTPGKDNLKTENSCAANSVFGNNIERKKAPAKRSYQFRTTTSVEGKEVLCLKFEAGETCYHRVRE